jgi:hypothetical protein
MATSRGFISEMKWYRIVIPRHGIEDGVKTFVLWWWRGIHEVLMSIVFGFDNVLRSVVVASLCRFWIMLAPGVGEACHVYEPWFDRRSDWGTVQFQVVIVVVRIDHEVRSIRNKIPPTRQSVPICFFGFLIILITIEVWYCDEFVDDCIAICHVFIDVDGCVVEIDG